MTERTIGLDKARPRLGELAIEAAGGAVTILTSHGHPVARIVPLETETDRRWNDAVDWLLNSRHTGDPDIQTAFWGIVDGKCTRETVDTFVSAELYGAQE